MMYEGKNVHYSPVDNRPLCSYSAKVCKQRRLNGYGFCLRHILEDPSSPFKQCIHIGKNKHQCNNPVPQSKDTEYCNSHLNMFTNAALKAAAAAGNALPPSGKIPRTAKTSSTQAASSVDSSALADIKMSIQDRLKSKFNLHKSYKDSKQQQAQTVAGTSQKSEDEDPYAFPDGDPEPVNKSNHPAVTSQSINDTVSAIVANCLNNHHLNSSGASGHAMTTQLVSNTSSVISSSSSSNSDTSTSTTVQTTPIAKLYPELAEKLHLPALSDRKVSPVVSSGSLSPGSASKTPPRNTKSARTINKLQTKIAQNRIKDKLKRSQSVSSSSNQSSPDRKTNPVSPVVTITTNWPTVSSAAAVSVAGTAISTSSTTSTTSSITSSSLQSLISQLPPLDQPLWSVQQQLQHGIQPANVTGHGPPSVTPAPNIPLLSIAPMYSNAAVTASSTHTTPLTTAMTTLSPNMTALQQLTHLATHHSPLLATASSLSTSTSYSPLLTVPTATMTSSFCATNHPPPPPYPGSPPRILEQSIPIPQPPKPKPPRKTKKEPKKEPKKDPKKATKAPPLPKPEPAPSISLQPPVTCTTSALKASLPVPKSSSSRCVKFQGAAKGLLTEKEARQKLKRHSALHVYAYYASLTNSTTNLLPTGVDSSDSEEEGLAKHQHHWLSSSSEEDNDRNDDDDDDEEEEGSVSMMRITKLSLLHARMRRQYMQIRRVNQVNASHHRYQQRALKALVDATRQSENAAVRAVKYIHHKRKAEKDEFRVEPPRKRACLFQGEDSSKCVNDAMPFTNHCHKHIMYNVEQQLFDYCTAKFSNNRQCCIPVFDIKHELPLCEEHGQKADNYQKSQEQGKPKKPRKKTKPSALTRPPKKGKKRKNQKKSKNPKPEDVTSQSDAMETEPEGDGGLLGKGKHEVELPAPASPAKPAAPVVHLVKEDDEEEEADDTEEEGDKQPAMSDFAKTLEPHFSPSGIDKCLDLPGLDMDEAAKFLDKHDLSDVLKEPFPDIFNSTSSSAPTPPLARPMEERPAVAEPPLAAPPPFLASSMEESDMIDQALADVEHGVAFPVDKEEDDDELTKQIIANSLLNHSPSNSDDDEANEQNLSKLASSLTPNDLKSISQALSSLQDPNQAIGSLLGYDNTNVPMTTTASSSMLLGYDSSAAVSTVAMIGGFQTASTVNSVLGYHGSALSVTSASSSLLLGYSSGSGINQAGLTTTVSPDMSTVSVSAGVNGTTLPGIGIEDYMNQAGLQLLGSNNQQALYNGHVMEPAPNLGSNIQGSTTIQAPVVSFQGSQQGIQTLQSTSSFQGNSIQAPLSQGITPGQHIQAPLMQQHLQGIQIQTPQHQQQIPVPQQQCIPSIQAPQQQQMPVPQQQNLSSIQATNGQPVQVTQQSSTLHQQLSFLSSGNSSLPLSNTCVNSSSNTLAALAQHRTSAASTSTSISSLAAALASAQPPSMPASTTPTSSTHIRHLLAAAAAKPVSVATSASSLSQLLGGSSTEASISQLAALFSSQQQGGRAATGNSNFTLAVALASQAPHLSHSLVTAAAQGNPPQQQAQTVDDTAAASANAQISAIAAALANNHPVPPINSTVVQSDSTPSGPANGLLKPPHTPSTHTSFLS